MFHNYNYSQLISKKLGKKTILNGWVRGIINKGGILFFSLHDAYGKIQVITKEKKLIKDFQKEVNSEDLLSIWGTVQIKQPKKNIEPSQQQKKEIEINLEKYQIINQTKPLPFEIKDEANINEDNRFRYRYLDLRRNVSKRPLIIRHHFLHQIRNYLYKQGFIEVETPILAQNSPEGAKCFVVPSSLGKQRYYTLPQSPQIFKQLLMMSGFARHYQIDKSFRNEDARSNRQIEFSQLDLEMSFTSTKKIMILTEKLLKYVLKKTLNYQLKTPFPILTYQQVIKKYGTDKPDLRNPTKKDELNFLWITDWPLFEYNEETKKYEIFRHPFTIPQKKYIKPLLNNKIKPEKVICEAFDLVCNGEEVLSGSLRIYQRELQEKVFTILGYDQQKQKKYFGYFLQALEFAAPPHGGFGLGIDRLLAIVLNLKSLKEVIAFPKNIDGSCSLTGTPNYLDEKL
ncbi:amino acid--tRNA ligase-related protein [endosymbiont GvMRE of Glomus versiforme]|uniref:amino acid--tRNA ligase-related protein n=1 Tax=endosymbiont GvMRE of Glomus versiforme TaxID=2039283 RepID=UPI000EE6EC1E|nr:amino acid--tRNA ligase-related protein [endosymbiont GvMRE of Glomus versiforme]RHZ36342.1 Aspartate--tRNA(Asp/Asn) ligase [endosymbiont GvMRE of Glomus versiforme]